MLAWASTGHCNFAGVLFSLRYWKLAIASVAVPAFQQLTGRLCPRTPALDTITACAGSHSVINVLCS